MSDDSRKSERVSVGMTSDLKKKLEQEADDKSMSLSSYARSLIYAGSKQIIAIEKEREGGNGLSLEQEVLEAIPRDQSDAVSQEDIADQVLGKLEVEIFEMLDKNDRIQHSAAHGGYYLK